MTTTSFADQFRGPLPRELRDQAARLSWDGFVSAYGRAAGPLSLSRWRCLDAERPAARLGPQGRTYQATIAVRGVNGTCTAAAHGPLAALTTMLHDRGITLEILGFHQLRCGAETATFIHGSNGRGAAWAVGFAPDAGHSALEAVISCANRLLTVQ
ncbi:homocitrate synthase [Mycolicibacter sinensis]|uniref:Homocitrate synthase n=1 Tax=Mycolicibacter sinensis (strain JDM601) TaxID=875328 RepID=A0A1A3U981_MYCSD|nr:homocitrate synthase [Mycolicibacter sinensis]OBK91202.1 homocitrate synthase [Mycolicibacter sinensis]